MERLSIRLLRWFIVLVAFGLMPLGIINYGFHQILDARWQQYVGIEARRLETLMEKAQKAHEPEHFYYSVLAQLAQKLAATGENTALRARLAQQFFARWHGLFDVYVLDSQGAVAFPAELPNGVAAFSLKKLAEAFREFPDTKSFKTNQSLFRYFVGDRLPPDSLVQISGKQRVVAINPLGRRTFFFGHADKRGALFAHVNIGVAVEWFPMRFFGRKAQTRLPGWAFGIWSMGGELVSGQLSGGEKQDLARALAEIELSISPWLVRDNMLIRSHNLDAAYRFWGVRRLNVSLRGDQFKARLGLYSFLFFLFLTLASFSWLVRGWQIRVSIRWKLMLLFGIASGLPLILLLVTGFDYLSRTEQVLKFDALRKLQDSLKMVDTRFPRFLHDCRQRLAALSAEVRKKQPIDFQGFINSLDLLRDQLGFYSPVVVKADGVVFQSLLSSENKSSDRLLLSLAFEMMQRYNRNMGFHETALGKVKSFEMALLNDIQLFGAIEGLFGALGKFTRVNLGSSPRFVLLELFLEPSGRADALLMLGFSTDRIFHQYLIKYQPQFQRSFGFGNVYSFHQDKPLAVPADALQADWLKTLRRRLMTRQEIISEELLIDGEPHLAVGMPGRELNEFLLVQSIPTREVTKLRDDLKVRLVGLGLSCLFLALAAGFLLAGQFLQPIASLTEGVIAIQAGRFRHRVPETLTHDELADLSSSFNTTLEKLQELSVARNLQESLFPIASLRVGALEVFGKSVAATELGGDYFDYFAVGENRIMLLIGDVAGHGTGSALQMAMAKTAMHFAVQIDPSPASVCHQLNQMILSCMRKKQMMTFFCALIDSESGEVRYVNAGHNNPMLVRANGSIEELATGGYPLGVRKALSFVEKSNRLEPGDRIWCYTDGLPECRNVFDQDLGYDVLKDTFRMASGDTALEICDQVLRRCHDYRNGAPQGDDMTLILLKRS